MISFILWSGVNKFRLLLDHWFLNYNCCFAVKYELHVLQLLLNLIDQCIYLSDFNFSNIRLFEFNLQFNGFHTFSVLVNVFVFKLSLSILSLSLGKWRSLIENTFSNDFTFSFNLISLDIPHTFTVEISLIFFMLSPCFTSYAHTSIHIKTSSSVNIDVDQIAA